MSEHFLGSNKGFEILANSVQNPLSSVCIVQEGNCTVSFSGLHTCDFYLSCSSLCQSATKGILRNMSLLDVRLRGLLPRVECIATFMTCILIDKASSMYSLALAISLGDFRV
jgi:hypothetical protein